VKKKKKIGQIHFCWFYLTFTFYLLPFYFAFFFPCHLLLVTKLVYLIALTVLSHLVRVKKRTTVRARSLIL